MIEKSKSSENLRKKAVKELIGSLVVGLRLDRRVETGRSTEQIDREMAARLYRDYQPMLDATTDELMSEYAELYGQVEAWHGTGRYQYGKDGEITDVLSSICKHKGLIPALDEYDVITGQMMSISLAKSRMYARAYADIHGTGQNEKHRYGGAGFWATYVGSRLPFDTLVESRAWRKDSRERIRTSIEKRTQEPWGVKVNMGFVAVQGATRPQHAGLFTPFYTGSDIDGNYPVLLGIKTKPPETEVAASIARHEVRTHQPIPLDGISHVEVPFNKIIDTERLLSDWNADIPVLAIETGEEYCSQLAFSSLVYPSRQLESD